MSLQSRMSGTISSCGFESGDRFVVGRWDRSPIGPTLDVMWARASGERILLAPDDRTAAFVTAVYEFDDVRVVPFTHVGSTSASEMHLVAGPIRLRLNAGRRVLYLPPRPLWVTKWLERPVAAALLGVRTWGTSPTGVQEWYQTRAVRLVASAAAELDDHDLGAIRPVRPVCGFGFSEAPRIPSIVEVRPTLLGPDGWDETFRIGPEAFAAPG